MMDRIIAEFRRRSNDQTSPIREHYLYLIKLLGPSK